MCCTVKDNGVEAIEKLMKKKGKFDYILLETSGVADPGPIANIFWLDDGLLSDIYLDGIVTVLDAGNIIKSLEDVSIIYNDDKNQQPVSTASIQIALADVIILNKIDTISSSEEVCKIHKRIRGINGVAPIIDTSYSKVSFNSIFDIKSYDRSFRFNDKMFNMHGWHDDVSTYINLTKL